MKNMSVHPRKKNQCGYPEKPPVQYGSSEDTAPCVASLTGNHINRKRQIK